MLQGVEITAHVRDGFSFMSTDGQPLTLKLVDSDGATVSYGAVLSKELMAAAVKAHSSFWQGCGNLIVLNGE